MKRKKIIYMQYEMIVSLLQFLGLAEGAHIINWACTDGYNITN